MDSGGDIRLVRGLPAGVALVHGECLAAMRVMATGSVDVIYLDPPFNSGRQHQDTNASFGDTWGIGERHVCDDERVQDIAAMAGKAHGRHTERYMHFMGARLLEMDRLLSGKGSIWLHCDDTAVHYLKVLMDSVFGHDCYTGDITWRRTSAHNMATRKFGRVTDRILHYARPGALFKPVYVPHDPKHLKAAYRYDDGDGKGPYARMNISSAKPTPRSVFPWRGYPPPERGWSYSREGMQRLDDQGLLHYPVLEDGSPDHSKRLTRKGYLSENKGRLVSNLWDDISNLHSATTERVGYPTQKPLALLERVLQASTTRDSFVFDPFCGSGTTLVAAARMGRRAMGVDPSPDAVKIARSRLEAECTAQTPRK